MKPPFALALLCLLISLLASALPGAASAADPVSTTISLTGPASAVPGSGVALVARLSELADPQTAVGGQPVTFWRRDGSTWERLADAVTAPDGSATQTVPVAPGDNVFRATYAGGVTWQGATSAALTVRAPRLASVLTLAGPHRVIDERSVVLRVRLRTSGGEPIDARVVVRGRTQGTKRTTTRAVLQTGRDGTARLRVAPRYDSVYTATVRAGSYYQGDTYRAHRVDNLPPGRSVRLPARAPKPRITLPPQQRATGAGPHAVITPLPDAVFRDMVGRSWHQGCLPRASLRLIRVNYWGYDGYRHRGELVIAAGVAARVAGAFSDIYRAQLPIRAMYRVDRFGYSGRVHGADNYASMASGNTSGFNCRDVVGRPGVRSPHATGRALDINTWENPYYSPADGWLPNSYWVHRSHPRVAWRSRSHPMVRIMASHGIRWSYAVSDSQHFDA